MTATPRPARPAKAAAGADPDCRPGDFTSGSITLVLDAPDITRNPTKSNVAKSNLPRMFRSSLQPLPSKPPHPSPKGLKEINASGSAQYSRTQLEAVLASRLVFTPMIVVDLRQESHGFLRIHPPANGERDIAVGWFVERDWINVGKDLPSIEVDQLDRLKAAAGTRDLTVNWICGKTAEDGIRTAKPRIVNPTGFATERDIVEGLGLKYVRFPTTDHVRPRDSEVDGFVRFAARVTRKTWLHFHCRGGDGRTTTFLCMHDIMCNAPQVGVEDILHRQFLLGGSNLEKSVDPASFASPFAIERLDFVRRFYAYVSAAKPGRYALTWSDWVAGRRKTASKTKRK